MATATSNPTQAPAKAPANGKVGNNKPILAGKGVLTEFPTKTRSGFWGTEFPKWQAEPGVIFTYENCSTTATTTIKKDYGAEAHSEKAHDDENGKTVCTVHVRYDPERVAEVKAEVERRGAARKAAAAEKKSGK